MLRSKGVSIQRRSNLSRRDFIEEYVRCRVPVIITDAAERAEWGAIKKWSSDYLTETVGSNEVTVRGGRYHVIAADRTRRFKEVVHAALISSPQDPMPYMYGVDIQKTFPELLPDLSDLKYYFPDRLRSRIVPKSRYRPRGELTLLLGGNGSRFPELHFDNWHMDVFVTQVRGDKEFIIFSPEQSDCVYQDPKYKTKSLIPDIENVDLDLFPLFKKARPISARVKEGETIYVPAGWWHTTKVAEFSIGVSMNTINAHNWREFCHYFCNKSSTPNPAKRFLKKAYFKCGGIYLSALEKSWPLNE